MTHTKETLYESDFAQWAEETARLLRGGRFKEVDVENVAEEIEGLARKDRQRLKNCVLRIVEHMLKLNYASGLLRDQNHNGWLRSILAHQNTVKETLEDSPSLRPLLPKVVETAYPVAVKLVTVILAKEINLPATCPFTLNEILGDDDREWLDAKPVGRELI